MFILCIKISANIKTLHIQTIQNSSIFFDSKTNCFSKEVWNKPMLTSLFMWLCGHVTSFLSMVSGLSMVWTVDEHYHIIYYCTKLSLCASNPLSICDIICHWICRKGSYTCNYKYLEMQFWNIQFNIPSEWLELPARVSPQIYSYSR